MLSFFPVAYFNEIIGTLLFLTKKIPDIKKPTIGKGLQILIGVSKLEIFFPFRLIKQFGIGYPKI